MGLAAPKNRSRISNDPQNTTWANNTTRFGHRILTSQGWTPGSSLGATDAAHAAHYTAASQSHIRVLLKDDNLGLGAKRGSERAEDFGLAGFASILGRLNGKAGEVKKEEERQEKIQRRAYVYRKYGFMNFVSGGFLVGDRIEKRVKREEVEVKLEVEVKSEPEASDSEERERKSKKRKRDGDELEVKQEEGSDEQPKLKRKKRSINLREEAGKEDADSESTSQSKSKKEKKDKKDKKDKKSKGTSLPPTTGTPTSTSETLSDKARRKAEKRARKEEKKLKKALKKAAKEAAKPNPAIEDPSSSSSEEDDSTPATSAPTTGTSTPASASGLTYNPRGMHAVRQRYIRQKKMASMDPQALKEIFMIKTPS